MDNLIFFGLLLVSVTGLFFTSMVRIMFIDSIVVYVTTTSLLIIFSSFCFILILFISGIPIDNTKIIVNHSETISM